MNGKTDAGWGSSDPGLDWVYRRDPETLQEALEDELLIMHRSKQGAVVLNEVAAVLWEALQWPLSARDLADLVAEAKPESSRKTIEMNVLKTLQELADAELIFRVEA